VISVDIQARRGEFSLEASFESAARRLALFGRSGAGKTTLLDAFAGLLRPSRGRIQVDGEVLFDSERRLDRALRHRRVGYVRQAVDLFPHMTVEQNLRFGAERGQGEPGFSVTEVLEEFGLQGFRHRRPSELSGGQARRVQMARAVASHPRLLLLDEPLASLDEASRREILPLLEFLTTRFRLPCLFVSHRFDEAVRFAEETVVLEEGRVLSHGEPFETLSRPAVWSVAKLAGVENLLAGVIAEPDDGEGGSLVEWETVTWHTPRLAGVRGEKVTLALFAEDVLLARRFSGRISARNCLEARVRRVSRTGGEALLRLEVGSGELTARVTEGALRDVEIVEGAPVLAIVKSTALRPIA
jgi:molybdate transport system ATP-binding protein